MPPRVPSETKTAIKESIKELFNDDEFLDRMLSRITVKIEALETNVISNTNLIKQLEGRIENMKQADKLNNVCFYNIQEDPNEKVTEKILKILNENVKITVGRNHIVNCYRIGQKKDNRNRPIIVKFEQYCTKRSAILNAKNLKGTKVGLMEDLTKQKRELYKLAQGKYDFKSVFTRYGNIFLKLGNKVHKIGREEDLHTINNRTGN